MEVRNRKRSGGTLFKKNKKRDFVTTTESKWKKRKKRKTGFSTNTKIRASPESEDPEDIEIDVALALSRSKKQVSRRKMIRKNIVYRNNNSAASVKDETFLGVFNTDNNDIEKEEESLVLSLASKQDPEFEDFFYREDLQFYSEPCSESKEDEEDDEEDLLEAEFEKLSIVHSKSKEEISECSMESQEHFSALSDLPIELLLYCFKFLNHYDLLVIEVVCRRWYEIIKHNLVWKKIYKRTYRDWYDNTLDESPHTVWRQDFWKIHNIHENWTRGRSKCNVLGGFNHTLRQLVFENNILVSSSGSVIQVWDLSTHQRLFTFKPNCLYVKNFCFDGETLVCSAGSSWTNINVYSIPTKRMVHTFSVATPNQPAPSVQCVQYREGYVLAGNKEISLWDLEKYKKVGVVGDQQRGIVNCLTWVNDFVVSSHKGKKIRAWDLKSGKRTYTLRGHNHLIHTIEMNGNHLISGSKDKTIRIWDIRKSLECRDVLTGHKGSVRTLQFDNWKIVSGGKDGDIRIWSLNDAKLLSRIQTPEPVYSIAFDEQKLFSGSSLLKLFDFSHQKKKTQTNCSIM